MRRGLVAYPSPDSPHSNGSTLTPAGSDCKLLAMTTGGSEKWGIRRTLTAAQVQSRTSVEAIGLAGHSDPKRTGYQDDQVIGPAGQAHVVIDLAEVGAIAVADLLS
jgi:hypothetical protein